MKTTILKNKSLFEEMAEKLLERAKIQVQAALGNVLNDTCEKAKEKLQDLETSIRYKK